MSKNGQECCSMYVGVSREDETVEGHTHLQRISPPTHTHKHNVYACVCVCVCRHINCVCFRFQVYHPFLLCSADTVCMAGQCSHACKGEGHL